jgi:hypothetical protein
MVALFPKGTRWSELRRSKLKFVLEFYYFTFFCMSKIEA